MTTETAKIGDEIIEMLRAKELYQRALYFYGSFHPINLYNQNPYNPILTSIYAQKKASNTGKCGGYI
jgi:hypothetical protein